MPMPLQAPPAIVQTQPQRPPFRLELPSTRAQRAIARAREAIATETHNGIQRGAQTRIHVHPDGTAKGTVVMYHGFTAGTWQFDLLAPLVHQAGYHVYVPRLPGHGQTDTHGIESPQGLPDGTNWERYTQFADQSFQDAADLGAPVSVLGLSVGGNVAAWVAERHPTVQKTIIYAPFLQHEHTTAQGIFNVVHQMDTLTNRHFGMLLGNLTHSWGEECRQMAANGTRPGHSWFYLVQAYGATELGRRVITNGTRAQAALQVFTTDIDDTAGFAAIRDLYNAWGSPRKSWYRYPAAEGIPHPMIHPLEDRGRNHTPLLYAMTLDALRGKPIERANATLVRP
jgi:pimeloyl-ACP methyl ester carboxylesterase